MTRHSHALLSWPFADVEDTASFTCVHVLDGSPILRVSHDEDGDWQFLCGELHDTADGRVVCLACTVVRDQSLIELADLPLGWGADRDDPDLPWTRQRNEAEPDEDQSGN